MKIAGSGNDNDGKWYNILKSIEFVYREVRSTVEDKFEMLVRVLYVRQDFYGRL